MIAGAAVALCAAAGSGLAAAEDAATAVPAYIQQAVADSSRPQADRLRDVNRKPAEVLAFGDIHPGMKIGELMPLGGYYTRLLCRVVGDSGHIYGVNVKIHMPPMPMPMPAGAAPMPRRAMPAPAPLGCGNVTDSTQESSQLSLPSGLDLVWTTENYHDLHNATFGAPNMKQFDQTVYDALKPGGVFLIEDHVAASGSGASDTNSLHRIDPALVRQEVESVGFQFAGQSSVVADPSDPHTVSSMKMVDKTDRFLFKFRKPG
jgi:predicted methyltransferase